MSDLKSIGNLFVNDYKKAANQPDFTGYLDITREQIQQLIADGKAGKEVKLKMAAWEYPSKKDPNQIRYFITCEAGDQKQGGQAQPEPKNAWVDDDPVPF